MTTTETTIPTLPAYRTRAGSQLAVWCEHEQRWHRHGAVSGTPGDGDGHRAAHCTCPNSPYDVHGYFVEEVGRLTTTVQRQHRETRRAGCPSCRDTGKGR